MTGKNLEKMIEETHLKQIQKQAFFHKHVAITRNITYECLECLKMNSEVLKCQIIISIISVLHESRQGRG